MKKDEFLNLIKQASDDDAVSFYEELILDRVENGEREEDVIADLNAKKVLRSLKFEFAKKELEQAQKGQKGQKRSKALVVILSLCSAPVTVPLGIALIAVLASLAAAALSLVVAGIGGTLWLLVGSAAMIAAGDPFRLIILNLGIGLIALGAMGLVGYYFILGIKIFYNWAIVKFFKMRKKDSNAEVYDGGIYSSSNTNSNMNTNSSVENGNNDDE